MSQFRIGLLYSKKKKKFKKCKQKKDKEILTWWKQETMKRSEGGHSLISPSSSSSSTPLMYRTLLHLCRWNTVVTIGCSFKGTDTDLIVHMIYFGTNESVIMMKQVYSWRLLKKDKEKEGTPLCLFWNKAAHNRGFFISNRFSLCCCGSKPVSV